MGMLGWLPTTFRPVRVRARSPLPAENSSVTMRSGEMPALPS